jgi:CxxC motif-containing protein (DUF1111 family)
MIWALRWMMVIQKAMPKPMHGARLHYGAWDCRQIHRGGQYFLMHDGRAKSIEAAIQLHGGEATNSKNKFNALTDAEKQKLILFLKSL